MGSLMYGRGGIVLCDGFGSSEGRIDPEAGEELEVLEKFIGIAESGRRFAWRRGNAANGAEGCSIGYGEFFDAFAVDRAAGSGATIVEKGTGGRWGVINVHIRRRREGFRP